MLTFSFYFFKHVLLSSMLLFVVQRVDMLSDSEAMVKVRARACVRVGEREMEM